MAENTEVKAKMISVDQMRYDALIASKEKLRVIEKYIQSSEYIDKETLKFILEA